MPWAGYETPLRRDLGLSGLGCLSSLGLSGTSDERPRCLGLGYLGYSSLPMWSSIKANVSPKWGSSRARNFMSHSIMFPTVLEGSIPAARGY
ncbi:hypothetical protein LWI28_027258 [Acer negundo]|uniref:Uncharacterized protein n=1 Tax=Acer negundo TaxID=4023 RepID=A0AAD5J3C0_ACENE|nr:hypothetical protein LWI28_027258 [Acer negundo]